MKKKLLEKFQTVTHAPFIIIAGAGASAESGVPTTKHLWRKIDVDNLLELDPIQKKIIEVFRTKRAPMERDIEYLLDDLEKHERLLTLILDKNEHYLLHIKNDAVIGKLILTTNIENLTKKIYELRKKLFDIIHKEYAYIHPQPKHIQVYQRLASHLLSEYKRVTGIEPAFLPIFTFNYDGIIEKCYGHESIKEWEFINGFVPTPDRQHLMFRLENYIQEFENSNEKDKIVLFKLHGSCEWDENPTYGIVTTNVVHEPPKHPVIIYPKPLKENEHKDDPFWNMYRILEESLIHCSIAIVIGYSFRDAPFERILKRALKKRTSGLKMVLICGAKTGQKIVSQFNMKKLEFENTQTYFVEGKEKWEKTIRLMTGQIRRAVK